MPPACFGPSKRDVKRDKELEDQRFSIGTLTRRVGQLSAELLANQAEARQALQHAREERDASMAAAKSELEAERAQLNAANAQLRMREAELAGQREQHQATSLMLKQRERELSSAKKQCASAMREREKAVKKAGEFAATLEQVSTVLAGLQAEEEPHPALGAGSSPILHGNRKQIRQSTAALQQLRQSIAVLKRDERDGPAADQS